MSIATAAHYKLDATRRMSLFIIDKDYHIHLHHRQIRLPYMHMQENTQDGGLP